MHIYRYFRFSLKDLAWLILVAACNLGWYVGKVKPVQELQADIKTLQAEVEKGRNDSLTSQKILNDLSAELEAVYKDGSRDRLKYERDRLYELLADQQKNIFAGERLQHMKQEEFERLKERVNPYDAGGGTYFLGPARR